MALHYAASPFALSCWQKHPTRAFQAEAGELCLTADFVIED
jgi:hypothetical protein